MTTFTNLVAPGLYSLVVERLEIRRRMGLSTAFRISPSQATKRLRITSRNQFVNNTNYGQRSFGHFGTSFRKEVPHAVHAPLARVPLSSTCVRGSRPTALPSASASALAPLSLHSTPRFSPLPSSLNHTLGNPSHTYPKVNNKQRCCRPLFAIEKLQK